MFFCPLLHWQETCKYKGDNVSETFVDLLKEELWKYRVVMMMGWLKPTRCQAQAGHLTGVKSFNHSKPLLTLFWFVPLKYSHRVSEWFSNAQWRWRDSILSYLSPNPKCFTLSTLQLDWIHLMPKEGVWLSEELLVSNDTQKMKIINTKAGIVHPGTSEREIHPWCCLDQFPKLQNWRPCLDL